MISVNPIGRLGNNLFQYTFAKIISERTGLSLKYSVGTNLIKTPEIDTGHHISNNNRIYITDFFDINKDHVIDINKIVDLCKDRNVLIHGYFQHKSYYNHLRKEIKLWLGEIPILQPSTTGIHIRKTDYIQQGWYLDDDYYERCIKLANPEKLLIFTDDENDLYVQSLLKRGAEIFKSDPETSLYTLGTCGKQIISRSTFSWWSSFLSSPIKVFYPKPQNGWWSIKDTPEKDISVDSTEYCYIDF